jgi:hypothetical protein
MKVQELKKYSLAETAEAQRKNRPKDQGNKGASPKAKLR